MTVIVPDLKFVPQVKTTAGYAASAFGLDDIPQDLKDQVEQVYNLLKENPGNFHAEFATKADALQWEAMVRAYCAQRPAGVIHYRRSPVRNQPDGHVNFRITDVPTKNEKDSKEINEAAAKVTTAAKKAAASAAK